MPRSRHCSTLAQAPKVRRGVSRVMTPGGAAMAQLKARDYADKYRHLGQPIHLVGVEFSQETRNLVGFVVEMADGNG